MTPPRPRDQRDTTSPQPGTAAHRAVHHEVPREFQERDERDLTGRYEGEELEERRAQRPVPERLAILETKADESARRHDAADLRVDAIAQSHAALKSSLDTIEKLAVRAEAERAARHEREAKERASFWKRLPAVIKAVGIAIAAVVTAALGYAAAHGGH